MYGFLWGFHVILTHPRPQMGPCLRKLQQGIVPSLLVGVCSQTLSLSFFFRVKEGLSREEIHSVDRVGAILEGKRGPGYGVVDKVIGKKWIYSERDTLHKQRVGHRRGRVPRLTIFMVSYVP